MVTKKGEKHFCDECNNIYSSEHLAKECEKWCKRKKSGKKFFK